VAVAQGLDNLIGELMLRGADAGAQTIMGAAGGVHRRTSLHVAVAEGRSGALYALLKAGVPTSALDTKDSEGTTPFSLALSRGMLEEAVALLKAGANVDVTNAEGFSLLHTAILNADVEGSCFLLNSGADIDIRTPKGQTALELAIELNLPPVVEGLCRKGADLTSSQSSDPPLWMALQKNQELASTLVR